MNEVYPYAPGFKVEQPETSKQAAVAIKSRAELLRVLVLEKFRLGSATADEIAVKLNESVLTIRPRVAELHKQGKLVDTGVRRQNTSGHSATVWRLEDDRIRKAFPNGQQSTMF
jgi:predicted ArsR family transcriptional regulator